MSQSACHCTNLLATYSKEDIEKLEQVNIMGWMNESRALLPEVYAFQNDTIDQAYIEKSAKIIENNYYLLDSPFPISWKRFLIKKFGVWLMLLSQQYLFGQGIFLADAPG